MEISVVVAQKS